MNNNLWNDFDFEDDFIITNDGDYISPSEIIQIDNSLLELLSNDEDDIF